MRFLFLHRFGKHGIIAQWLDLVKGVSGRVAHDERGARLINTVGDLKRHVLRKTALKECCLLYTSHHRPAGFFAQAETMLRIFRLNVQDSVPGSGGKN